MKKSVYNKKISGSDKPFLLIEGMLQKYKGKINSIELQHSTKKLWIK